MPKADTRKAKIKHAKSKIKEKRINLQKNEIMRSRNLLNRKFREYIIMYFRYLLQTNPFGWIFDILLPFSRRTHRVRTAKMSLYNKNPSRNISFRKFREHINRNEDDYDNIFI